MNVPVVLFLFATLLAVNAGEVPAAEIIQGPSSRTTLVGPDGSVISAVAPGGQVIADLNSGVVIQPAPIATVQAAPVVAVSVDLEGSPVTVSDISEDGTEDGSSVTTTEQSEDVEEHTE